MKIPLINLSKSEGVKLILIDGELNKELQVQCLKSFENNEGLENFKRKYGRQRGFKNLAKVGKQTTGK